MYEKSRRFNRQTGGFTPPDPSGNKLGVSHPQTPVGYLRTIEAKEGAGLEELSAISREAPVLIAGPTASGKSGLAMRLSARDGRVIVNADALQVYANWRILTARPGLAEEEALPHALYGHVGRMQTYSVGHWLREVAGLLARPVVIVGGTGLYLSALTEGLVEIPAVPPGVRAEADARRRAGGVAGMLEELDAGTRARIDPANPMRVQRAWEVLSATGRGLAEWQAETGPALLPKGAAQALVLRPDARGLERRIRQRLGGMLRAGVLEEVRGEMAFHATGAAAALPSARAIGAAALMAHLRGEASLDAAREAVVVATRQYAKRQRTWFRSRMAGWHTLDPGQ